MTNTTYGPAPGETRPEIKLDTCYFLLVDNCNTQDNCTQSQLALPVRVLLLVEHLGEISLVQWRFLIEVETDKFTWGLPGTLCKSTGTGGRPVVRRAWDPPWLRDIAVNVFKVQVFICKMGVIILC